jgi:hypothetical protein
LVEVTVRFQRTGMCAAALLLVIAAGAQVSLSRPLADGPVRRGFLLADQGSAAEETMRVDIPEADSTRAAEGSSVSDSAAAEAPPRTEDSSGVNSAGAPADSLSVPPVRTKNPTGALLRSLALPGWGQLYNEQYIKSALVLAAEGLLVAGAVVEHQRAGDDHAVYQDLSRSEAVREAAWNRYSRRIDKRNAYLWYYAGFKFLSVIDAYVDAHLYRFDEGPFGVEVRAGRQEEFGLAVLLRFPMK